MDNLNAMLQYIGDHESLFSGLAALVAIFGVCFALVERLRRGRAHSDNTSPPSLAKPGVSTPPPPTSRQQDIHYTHNKEGHKLAWSVAGEGKTLVRSLGWFTNLEVEWRHPTSRGCIDLLAGHYHTLRYDARGMGLSEREVSTVSAATRLADLEAVVEAAGLERFILMGLSEGGTTAIEYAAKYPERVSHLILWGTFLKPSLDQAYLDQWTALLSILPEQWGSENRSFRQMLTALFIPDGNAEQNEFFNEMQKRAASADIATQTILSISDIDVTDVARSLDVPTLVMHRVNDLVVPMQQSLEIAATIPGAKLMQLQGANHWMLSDAEATREMIEQINLFVGH